MFMIYETSKQKKHKLGRERDLSRNPGFVTVT